MNTAGALSASALAAIAVVLAIYLHRKKVWPKTIIIAAFIGGLGVAGALGRAVDWTGEKITSGMGTATAALFGAAVPAALAIIWILAVYFALKPKGPGPTKYTAPIAFMLPTVLLAVGGVFADVGGLLQDGFGFGAGQAGAAFTSVVQDLRSR